MAKLFTQTIDQFFGIQQQYDGSLIPLNAAYDCRNFITLDGNLTVAKGYTKYIPNHLVLSAGERILKLIIVRLVSEKFYIVTNESIYKVATIDDEETWTSIYDFPATLDTEQIDFIQTKIGLDEYIIIATGNCQMVKVKVSDDTATEFGSGEKTYQDATVSSYSSATRTVVLSKAMEDLAQSYAKRDGIVIADNWYEVGSVSDSTTVILSDVDSLEEVYPSAGESVYIRGGGSDASTNFVEMYYNRLFSAGDPLNPCRLYYSAAIGSGRTYEDWLSDWNGSTEASGGYIEVGDSNGDAIVGIITLSSQMLIFKRYSVYRLYGNRPSAYTLERIENYAEHMSNASLVVRYDVPYYLTKTGIKYYDGTGIQPLNNGIRYLRDFLTTIKSVRECKAFHADNILYFTCKCNEDSVYDDTIIVYDIGRQAFTIRDGFQIADMSQYDGTIFLVNGNGYVYKFNDGDTYDGEHINAYWLSQKTDLGTTLYKKQLTDILMRGGGNEFIVTVMSGVNKVEKHLKWTQKTEEDILQILLHIDLATSFQFKIENEQGSHFHIDGGVDIILMREMEIR